MDIHTFLNKQYFDLACPGLRQVQIPFTDEKWDKTGISDHASTCKVGFCWTETKLLKTEERKFERKVREALEIQLQQTSPYNDQGLNQNDGQYVSTNFWKPMLAHISVEVVVVA